MHFNDFVRVFDRGYLSDKKLSAKDRFKHIDYVLQKGLATKHAQTKKKKFKSHQQRHAATGKIVSESKKRQPIDIGLD